MKEMTIDIVIPEKGRSWRFFLSNRASVIVRKDADGILTSIDKVFPKAGPDTKTHVTVRKARGIAYDNFGTFYGRCTALYAIVCFLEDYLSKDTFKKLSKKYYRESLQKGGE